MPWESVLVIKESKNSNFQKNYSLMVIEPRYTCWRHKEAIHIGTNQPWSCCNSWIKTIRFCLRKKIEKNIFDSTSDTKYFRVTVDVPFFIV